MDAGLAQHIPVGLVAAPDLGAAGPHVDPATPLVLRPLAEALARVDRVMVVLGTVALLATSPVPISSVVSRYFLKASTGTTLRRLVDAEGAA